MTEIVEICINFGVRNWLIIRSINFQDSYFNKSKRYRIPIKVKKSEFQLDFVQNLPFFEPE